RPMQRASRVPVTKNGEVLVDGHTGVALNVSPLGVQVRSTHVMRPNARVRVTFGAPRRPFVLAARVVWSVFEFAESPCYRAGLEFLEPYRQRLADREQITERLVSIGA